MVALDMQGEQPRKHISLSKKKSNEVDAVCSETSLVFSLTRCWPHQHNQRLAVKQRHVKPGPFEKIQEKQERKKRNPPAVQKKR